MHPHHPARHGASAFGMDSRAAPAVCVHLNHPCPIMRAGLAAILAAHAGFVVCEASACRGHACGDGIVITDYAGGLVAAGLRCTLQQRQAPRVVILTTRDKEWDVRQAVSSGVDGYLLPGCSAEELVECLRRIVNGGCYLSAMATRSLADSSCRAALTRRETDVLRSLAKGLPDKLIARELGIGPGTVKSHLKNLLHKLNATARTHAVVVALERGLLSNARDDMPAIGRRPNQHVPV